MNYCAQEDRYESVAFRNCGQSALALPPISLGTWQNFGAVNALETCRMILRRAFDRGITHFDIANMYGPPRGSAEENVGKILQEDFRSLRNELVISTKAGYEMWPGPYGKGASKKHLIASIDGSLSRLGLDYVDIFYAHRPWPDDSIDETVGALAQIVKAGKALYVGISSFSPERTRVAYSLLQDQGIRLAIHQPSYSMLNRHIEDELLDTLGELGVGCIGFSALAQGLLTDKYLNEASLSDGSGRETFSSSFLTAENLKNIRGLNEIARGRGQTLAQMAIAWVLRDRRVTSALIGARTVEQLDGSLDAVKNMKFTEQEFSDIDEFAKEGGIDLWRETSLL
jgi:L-glyceraldehyde 3-phosphate reductase